MRMPQKGESSDLRGEKDVDLSLQKSVKGESISPWAKGIGRGVSHKRMKPSLLSWEGLIHKPKKDLGEIYSKESPFQNGISGNFWDLLTPGVHLLREKKVSCNYRWKGKKKKPREGGLDKHLTIPQKVRSLNI